MKMIRHTSHFLYKPPQNIRDSTSPERNGIENHSFFNMQTKPWFLYQLEPMPGVLPYSPFCRIALSELYALQPCSSSAKTKLSNNLIMQQTKLSQTVTERTENLRSLSQCSSYCAWTRQKTQQNIEQTFNKPSTNFRQSFHKPSTNHQQTIHKLSTNSRQTLNKLSTNLRQTIEKLSTNSRQTFHKLSTNSWQTLHKLLTNLQQSLARTFRAFLQTFCKPCKHSFKNTNQ